jgi:hypothetical protein
MQGTLKIGEIGFVRAANNPALFSAKICSISRA